MGNDICDWRAALHLTYIDYYSCSRTVTFAQAENSRKTMIIADHLEEERKLEARKRTRRYERINF